MTTKKDPDKFPRYIFRASGLEKPVDARTDTNQSPNEIVKRDLLRWYEFLACELPAFSEEEAFLLVDAFNGHKFTVGTAHLLWAEIDEFLIAQQLLSKHETMNRESFVARLRSLSRGQCLAVADAIEQFWLGRYHKSGEETRERLREVGLVRTSKEG